MGGEWRLSWVQQLANSQSLAKPGLHEGLSDTQAWVILYPPPRLQGQEGERTLNAQIKSSLSAKVASGEKKGEQIWLMISNLQFSSNSAGEMASSP